MSNTPTATNFPKPGPDFHRERALWVRDRAYWLLKDEGVNPLDADQETWSAAVETARSIARTLEAQS